MSGKMSKKLRKYYKSGLQKLAIKDFNEYSKIVKKQKIILLSICIFLASVSIFEFICLFRLLVIL